MIRLSFNRAPLASVAFSALAALAALPLAAGGAIRVENRVKMMMMDGGTTSWVSPAMKRTENHFEMKGMLGAMARMGGGGNTIVIERADKGVIWTLNPEAKTYTERPMNEPPHGGQSAPRGGRGEHGKMKIVDAGASVTATGKSRTVNGWPCSEYLVKGWIEMEDEKTHEHSKWLMNNTMWTTPEKPLLKRYHDAELAFARAKLAKMGVTAGADYSGALGLEMLGGRTGMGGAEMAPAMAKMAVEMKKLSGVPILTLFSWTIQGKEANHANAEARDAKHEMTPEQEAMMRKMGIKMPTAGEGGGMTIEGEMEIKSLKDEDGDFEIPAGYRKTN